MCFISSPTSDSSIASALLRPSSSSSLSPPFILPSEPRCHSSRLLVAVVTSLTLSLRFSRLCQREPRVFGRLCVVKQPLGGRLQHRRYLRLCKSSLKNRVKKKQSKKKGQSVIKSVASNISVLWFMFSSVLPVVFHSLSHATCFNYTF